MEKRGKKGRSVEQLAGIASWEWDIFNDTWYVSDNWVEIHGCLNSQLNSSQLFAIAHPEDRPAIEDAFHKALKDGIPYDIHHRIIRQDTGEIRYVYAKGVVEFNDSGKPKTLIGAVQDITDHKLTELALQKSEEILNETQKLTKVGGWEWDVMKQTMTWTDEVYRIHDFSFEEKKLNVQELISRSINCYHSDHQEKIAEAFKRCVEQGEPYDLEMPFTSAKGRKLWVRTIGRAVKERNKVVRVVGNIMDITDRKQADEKIIQAHETYLGIINSIKESIYILDKDGVFLEVNQAAISSHGLRREDLIGKTLEVLSADEKNDLPLVAEMIAKAFQGEPMRFEFWGRRIDGTEFPDEITLTKGVFFGKKVVIALARDITDRKQTEKALQERDEMMRNSQSVAHICSYSTNLNEQELGKSTWVCSPEFYKIFGIDETYPHTIEGWGRFIHPDYREELMVYHESVVKERKSFDHEYKIIRINDGAERWVQGTGELVYDEQGKPVRMHGAIQDITQRKLDEENLRQSKQLLQSISDNMFDLVALTDFQGIYTFVGASLKIIGYPPDKLVGTNVMEYVHPEDLPKVKVAFEELMANKKDNSKIVYRNRCADGAYIWLETVGIFIEDENGNPQQILFNSRDITERIKADLALRESEERFRLLADIAPVGIIITNDNQDPVYASPAFTHIFGYTIDDIPSVDHWFALAYPDENFRHKVKQKWVEFTNVVKSEGGIDNPLEFPVHCRNGSIKQIEFRLAVSGGINVVIFTDITERKKAQEEIAKERMQLLSIFNSIDEIIYISDIETHEILYVNKKLADELKKDCVGGKCYKELQNLDSPCSFCTNSILKENNEQPYYWIFHNHYLNKEYAITDRLIDWPDGRKVRFEIAIDETLRKNAEQALRENEERYRKLYEETPVMLHSIDREGRILSVSNTWLQKLGYSKEEVIGRKSTDFLTEESRKQAEEIFLPIFFKTGRAKDVPYKMITSKGEIIDVLMSSVAEKNEKNEFVRSMAVMEDVTERIKAVQALRESEERFRSLFENATIGIYRSNPHGRILMANQTLVKMLGYSSFEELEKRNLLQHGLELNPSLSTFQQLMQQKGEVHALESVWKINDGSIIYVSESARAFKDEKGEVLYYQGTVEDITYRKQAEEIQKELEIANNTARFKQNFLANMSHEIRTPLTGVMGMIDILEQTPLSHIQRDYLDTIKTSGENLREIIDQVLDFSKIEAGKVSIYTRVFEFSSLPHNAEALYKNNVKAGVKIMNVVDPDIPPYIEADKARLAQVLNNLISNAVKFTPKGVITIHSSLLSTDSENGQVNIKVEITDTGIGIREDLQKKLFTPFSQVEDKDTRSYEGTGLGLSICKQLVEMMGGEIGMSSEDGKGSKFWFTFPAKIAQQPQLMVQEKLAWASPKKLHILFAEDKVVNQKVVKIMLTSMGHEVCIARNGQEAIDLYRPGRFDIILMDIQMPVMDGVTATRKLKEEHQSLPPIVGLSANAFEGDREKYMALGMDDYLTKPVKKADFEQLVARILHPS